MPFDRPANPLQSIPALPPLDVELVEEDRPGTIELDDGGVLIDFNPEQDDGPVAHGANLVEEIDEGELAVLSADLVDAFNADRLSRQDWERTYIKGLDLMGLTFEERDKPWAGACGVFHPLLAEAVIRFQSQAIQEVFPAKGPARTNIVGEESLEKIRQAKRVQGYLNYLTTEEMAEYRDETDRLLFSLPLAGSAFRKVYRDESLGRPVSMFVPAEDFVVSYGAANLETCERATHIMKRSANWVRKRQVSGFYRDIDLLPPAPENSEIERKYDKLTGDAENYDYDDRYTLLEMHVTLDLAGFEDEVDGILTGVELPYVVTIDKSSREVLAIRRNWLEDDPDQIKRDHFVHYQYLPGLGFYGFGLVHIIGGLTKSATSLLRQLIDAGTLANLPGGLKARGLRIKGDDTPIMPGEFRDVDVPGGAIKDNIAFMPYKEPSAVLYQLLGDLVQEGRRFASAADMKAADMNAEAPVGTTLAILEREMKVINAVQARIHHAMGRELKILKKIVHETGPEEYPYEIEGEFTVKEDFGGPIGIIPVSDPNAGSMAQRIMQFQAALQLSATAPHIYDEPRLHRQMLEVLGISEAEKIVPTEEDMIATDPVTENMSILNGKPVKAFLYQDHEAHIQTHMTASQHPQMAKTLEHHPNIKAIQATMMAHIAEHVAMAYRAEIEKQLGVELPPPDQPLPEDIELRLSRLVAPAAAQITGKAQQQAQAEKNAEQQKDPIIQMQERELTLKEEQAKDKSRAEDKRLMADIVKSRERLALDQKKLEQDGLKEEAKLIGDLIKTQIVTEQQYGTQLSRDQIEGFRIGMELAQRIVDNQVIAQDRVIDGQQ